MRKSILLWVSLLSCTLACFAADDAKTDPWAGIRFLIGNWQGTTTGEAGQGGVGRRYEFVLNGKFIRETDTTLYPPKDKNDKGQVREHWSFYSFDKGRNRIVLRQFYGEGFVYQFVLDPVQSKGKKLVFESERLESFRNKWRARLTYEVRGTDKFTETFELAPPDTKLEVFSKTEFRKTGQ